MWQRNWKVVNVFKNHVTYIFTNMFHIYKKEMTF